MEPRARHILIGFFVVAVLALAIFSGLWLMRIQFYAGKDFYRILFRESVSGLSTGSAVLFSGVNVGEIVKLELDKQNPIYVYATIQVDKDVPIRVGTEVRKQFMGVTGQSVVSLSGSSVSNPLLRDSPEHVDPVSKLPLLEATPSPLSALLDEGQTAFSNFTEMSVRLKDLFSEQNVLAFSHILHNVDVLSTVMVQESGRVRQVLTEASQGLQQLRTLVTQGQQLMQGSHALLQKEGGALLVHAQQAMQSVLGVTQRLHRLIEDNEVTFYQGMQSFKEMSPAIIEFKNAFSLLQSMLKQMEDSPANYLLEGKVLKEFTP